MSSFWKLISVSQFIKSSPRNIDLFLSDDVISWSGKTDSFKEKVFPRKLDLFPHFSKKSSLLEKENRYLGEMGLLAASDSELGLNKGIYYYRMIIQSNFDGATKEIVRKLVVID